jgi:hypothetical protein
VKTVKAKETRREIDRRNGSLAKSAKRTGLSAEERRRRLAAIGVFPACMAKCKIMKIIVSA